MLAYGFFILNIILLALVALLLHYYSPRFGLSGVLLFLAAITGIFAFVTPWVIIIEPSPDILMTIPWDILLPVILLVVLVLYVADGTQIAQQSIYGVAGINLLALGALVVMDVFVVLSDDSLPSLNFDARDFFVGALVFIVDMFVIAIVYQGIINAFPRVSPWVPAGMALLVSLWTDSVLFHLLSVTNTEEFARLLPGDILIKTTAGIVLWFPAVVYLNRIAPDIPEFAGENPPRRTFDILFGTVSQIIAALQQSREELRESKINFQQLTENINEVFWLANPKRRIAYYLSPAFEAVMGIDRKTFFDNPESLIDIIHEEDRDRFIENLQRDVLEPYVEEFRINRDGETRWIRNRVFPIKDEHGMTYRLAGVAEDITAEQQAAEQKIQLAIEQERVRILQDFISDASHDLKNPITGILLKAELIRAVKSEEKRQEHVDDLIEQAQFLSRMIENLFTLSRLENINGFVEVEQVDINALVDALCQQHRPHAEAKDITLSLDLEQQNIPPLMGDEDNLSRALGNLLSNAIRYTPEGGSVYVQTSYQFDRMIISVEDTGIGIDQDEIDRVFNRFFRAKTATNLKIKGSGLGLAIVRQVIKKHGGEIDVKSEVGKGTTFTVSFPA